VGSSEERLSTELHHYSLSTRRILVTMESEDNNTKKIKPWGRADKHFLSSLIFDADVDIYSTDNAYIEQVRSDWFPNRTELNFRRNFKAFGAEWDLEQEVNGGRRSEVVDRGIV